MHTHYALYVYTVHLNLTNVELTFSDNRSGQVRLGASNFFRFFFCHILLFYRQIFYDAETRWKLISFRCKNSLGINTFFNKQNRSKKKLAFRKRTVYRNSFFTGKMFLFAEQKRVVKTVGIIHRSDKIWVHLQ